jgi:hypothetical protein
MPDLIARTSTALVPVRAGAWLCKKLQIADDGRLSVRFEAQDDGASFDLDLQKASEERPASRGLKMTSMSVRGRLDTASQQRQSEASALVRAIAGGIDARVAAQPELSLAEALGRDATPRSVRFSRQLVLDMLGPDWQPGAKLPGDWLMHDVFPASQLRQTAALTLAVELRHQDGRRLVLLVGQTDHRPVLAKTVHFDLEHLTLGADPGPDGAALLTLLCFALQLRDHAGLTVTFPSVAEDVAALPAPEPVAHISGRAVNLAIPADCGQACAFCSALAALPPQDGGALKFSQLNQELRQARESGAGIVRFNGYDPLAFSRILDVMAYAVELGYVQAEIWSPCTRLAEPKFRAEVLRALPIATRFFVPLYGGSAEKHDAYVGRPGAFAQIRAAILGLQAERGADVVQMTSVLTRQNLHELVAMQSLCRDWGVPLTLHLPFPTSESMDDRYFTEAVPFSELADRLAEAWARHRFRPEVAGLPPCVLLPKMRDKGARVRDWLSLEISRHQPAGAYRDEKYQHSADGLGSQDTRVAPVVPCPRAGECAMAVACSREVLRYYAERFGLAELVPVGLGDVLSDG